MTTPVMWFRRDLRLADNPALAAAAAGGRCRARCSSSIRRSIRAGAPPAGVPRRAAWPSCTTRRGGALVVRRGESGRCGPGGRDRGEGLDGEHRRRLRPLRPPPRRGGGRRRSRATVAASSLRDRRTPSRPGPSSSTTAARTPSSPRSPGPGGLSAGTSRSTAGRPLGAHRRVRIRPGAAAGGRRDPPPAGEAAAHRRLDAFLAGDLDTYDADRDRPDLDTHQPPVALPALGLPAPASGARPARPTTGPTSGSAPSWRGGSSTPTCCSTDPSSAWWNFDARMDDMVVDDGPRRGRAVRRLGRGVYGVPDRRRRDAPARSPPAGCTTGCAC